MSLNTSLRYGLNLDRDFFLDFAMSYMSYMPFITALTLHPIIQYLLIFKNKNMRRDIRVGYIFTHIALFLDEWSFCYFFRIYPLLPIAALYCEGPLCTAGLDNQLLMSILAIPVMLINPPFIFLVARMHQMSVPLGGGRKMSIRLQLMLYAILNLLLVANVVGSGYFGRDHDRSAHILEEPELTWLKSRGGSIFLYGPPGDPQYFKWELRFLAISILIISPPLIFFTADAMNNIRINSASILSGSTQAMARRMFHVFLVQCTGAVVCYVVPLSLMLSSMIIDSTFIPGWIFAPCRFTFLMTFTINDHQFCIFFIFKNKAHRKLLAEKAKQFLRIFRSGVKATAKKRKRSTFTQPYNQSLAAVNDRF